ncbi:hypothetical protein DPMN_035847 [Dreissena polymorpha]|uniref:Uncharacterized protein n=1 Tax=Dreissena polymorpha TaxID=45954 RepID=A0A9D4RNA1_DREPO|nr:hypothetical protein DPMN_035831 [Dreissena polymorpha]KAH3872628.1 hypothetical protein DPMN_035847 [Dreissena polymorpha]
MMEEICGDRAYTNTHMKTKLLHHFGDCISVISQEGKCDKVVMKKTLSAILHKFSEEQCNVTEEEKKKNIISTAAKFIKADINAISSPKKYYASALSVSSVEENKKTVPESVLHYFRKYNLSKGRVEDCFDRSSNSSI